MAKNVAEGSHTISVVGNEETPTGATISNPAVAMVLKVDVAALAAGEFLEVKTKCDVRSADTTRVEHSQIISWLEAASKGIIAFPPMLVAGGEITFTLKQIGGSARSFPWAWVTP